MRKIHSGSPSVKAAIFCLGLLLAAAANFSYASLLITPTRVLIEDGERSEVVTLLNNSNKTRTYRIELENKIQTHEGGYIDISSDASYPGNSAMDFIRFSPKIVTIEPGKYQKIKLRVRKPSNLADGEYRVHLAMKSMNSKSSNRSKEGEDTTNRISTRVEPKLSFSIPVILRNGNTSLTTNFQNVQLLPSNGGNDNPDLTVEVARQGTASSVGSFLAYMKSPNSPQVQHVGTLNNVSIYPEIDSRNVRIPLWVDAVPEGAIIQVVYEGSEEYKGRTLGQAAFKYSGR